MNLLSLNPETAKPFLEGLILAFRLGLQLGAIALGAYVACRVPIVICKYILNANNNHNSK